FFFSSRRRHTRFSRDWSSDVCSSDLAPGQLEYVGSGRGGSRVDWEPSDFRPRVPADAGAGRRGNDLRTEADAEQACSALEARSNETDLGLEPRQFSRVVDAHGATHDDDHVGRARRREPVARVKPRSMYAVAVLCEPRFDASGAFERDVLDDQGSAHQVRSGKYEVRGSQRYNKAMVT